MKIRKLEKSEHFDASLISMIAFHFRTKNLELTREEAEKEQEENWGAFSEDGILMARIINNRFLSYFNGTQIRNSGIGAVSTLPEYREDGAIRQIFSELLKETYQAGDVISTLYPFNHAFYRKFGYEVLVWQNRYEFAPAVLRGYHFHGKAVQWRTGDPVGEFTALYNKFACGYNLAKVRDDACMETVHLKNEYYTDGKFVYALYEGSTMVAYLAFTDLFEEKKHIIRVDDLAFDGRTGFHALLGFLGRFTADYAKIILRLPMGLELLSLIQSPLAYEIRKETCQEYMIRIVNAGKLLELLEVPEGESFVIRISDEIIKENCGTWKVTKGKAVLTDETPDLCVSERAFGQMAIGGVDLQEASFRLDVEILGNEGTLKKIFVRKPLLMLDAF